MTISQSRRNGLFLLVVVLSLLAAVFFFRDRHPALKPLENSLSMKFIAVPGTDVLFCIWKTRVQDYAAFASEVSGVDGSWKHPAISQEATHPVVNVSWDEAERFAAWLTAKEQKTGKLSRGQRYRLPADAEWSVAVGLPKEIGRTPRERNLRIKGVYPWGTQWPPPKDAGNYGDRAGVENLNRTSPVGSFPPNRFGLYDLGGNAWEWCEDSYDDISGLRVLRGASWDIDDPEFRLSSFRRANRSNFRHSVVGFRLVLAGVPP